MEKSRDYRKTSPEALLGVIQEITRFPLFKNLDKPSIEKLCTGGEIRINKHREILFHAGDPANYFGLVLSGAYKLSRTSPWGEDSIMHFCAPGDILAALIMAQPNSVYPVNIIAMGPSRVLLLTKEIYTQYWLPNPELIARVQGLLSTRMSGFQGQRALLRAPLYSKIAALLLQLVAKEKSSSELEVPLPLTRKEIADTLGVTVESVIRVMSDWAKKGYIHSSDQYIKILEPSILIELVHEKED